MPHAAHFALGIRAARRIDVHRHQSK
jgi:hypothetical protein